MVDNRKKDGVLRLLSCMCVYYKIFHTLMGGYNLKLNLGYVIDKTLSAYSRITSLASLESAQKYRRNSEFSFS